MKALVRCLAVMIFIILCMTVVQAGEGSWRVIRKLEISQPCYIAGFLNLDFGITGGYGGATYYTTDGGKSWRKALNAQPLCRHGLEILNAQTAFIIGVGGLWHSNDSGRTWQQVVDPDIKGVPSGITHGMYLSFPDSMTGWVASTTILGITTDGAASFNRVKLPANLEKIAAISACSIDEGYLLDTKGRLYYTKDMGRQWTMSDLKLTEEINVWDTPAAAMRFNKDGSGIVVVESFKLNSSLVFRTGDHGRTWRREKLAGNFGNVYLSADGSLITIYADNTVTVIEWRG